MSNAYGIDADKTSIDGFSHHGNNHDGKNHDFSDEQP